MPPAPRISGSTISAATASCRHAASSASSVACSRPARGKGQARDVEQQRLVGRVEHAARADRHAADGVAVIGVLQREDAAARLRRDCAKSRAPSSARPRPRSSRCRRRTRSRRPGGVIATSCRASSSAGSWVKPAKITWSSRSACALDRRHDARMAMAMGDHPPGRDRVEDAPAVGGLEPRALARRDLDRLGLHRVLGEGMPDRRAVQSFGGVLQEIVARRSSSAKAACRLSAVSDREMRQPAEAPRPSHRGDDAFGFRVRLADEGDAEQRRCRARAAPRSTAGCD